MISEQAVIAAALVLHQERCALLPGGYGCSHTAADVGPGDLRLATEMLEAAAHHLVPADLTGDGQ